MPFQTSSTLVKIADLLSLKYTVSGRKTVVISLFFSLAFTLSTFKGYTQEKLADNGNVRIVRDYRLDVLLERFNKADKVKGFRIQIHSGIRRETARKTKSEFLLSYPETSCYETYQQPYYNVKVGNFLTKLEAQRFLNKLREHFPNSYIVPDYIQPLSLGEKR